MAFSFLAGHTFEIVHFRGQNWRANESQVVQLSDLTTRLIVPYKNLYVLYTLEFHISQIDRIALVQVLWIQSKVLNLHYF